MLNMFLNLCGILSSTTKRVVLWCIMQQENHVVNMSKNRPYVFDLSCWTPALHLLYHCIYFSQKQKTNEQNNHVLKVVKTNRMQ